MRKLIYIVGTSLILTGCSTSISAPTSVDTVTQEVAYIEYTKENNMYINDDMKKVIEDINNLGDKYKKDMDERQFDSLYIDIYEEDYQRIKDINFNNKHIYGLKYFNELVEILDNSLAGGLKEYVNEMKDKKFEDDGTVIEKIGNTVVFIEPIGNDEENYISIKVNFLDVEDEYYRDIFNKISDGKYVLDNVIRGERLNLIDFININANNPQYYYEYKANNLEIRYNIFLEDKDIEKVNILMKGKMGLELEYDDIGVFINLLNTLELSENEKDLLLNEYKNIVGKDVNKTMSLDNYKVLINYNKANTYSDNDKKLIYFSIERN